MTYLILALLLGFLAWLLHSTVKDIGVELSQLTTCDHCGGTGKHECFQCIKAFMGERSYVPETTFPCRECQHRDGDRRGQE